AGPRGVGLAPISAGHAEPGGGEPARVLGAPAPVAREPLEAMPEVAILPAQPALGQQHGNLGRQRPFAAPGRNQEHVRQARRQRRAAPAGAAPAPRARRAAAPAPPPRPAPPPPPPPAPPPPPPPPAPPRRPPRRPRRPARRGGAGRPAAAAGGGRARSPSH